MRSATWPGPCESPGTDSSRAGDGVTYTLSCKMLNRASGSKRMEWTKARGLGRSWWTGAVSVLSIGAMLRIFNLGLKPLHADEGVNGLFLLGLFREGIYRYNPANYHGPSLYYFALISCSINNLLFGSEGPSTVAVRMVPVLFGIGIIGIVLAFRDQLGTIGALAASTLAAVSPGMVYLSRDFIHEMLLVFFTLWLALCSMRFVGSV